MSGVFQEHVRCRVSTKPLTWGARATFDVCDKFLVNNGLRGLIVSACLRSNAAAITGRVGNSGEFASSYRGWQVTCPTQPIEGYHS